MQNEKWQVRRWFEAIHCCEQTAEGYALVTVLTTAGSTPREQGTKMVVTADRQFDTIGGGHLEFKAIELARQALADSVNQRHNQQAIHSFPLASKLGQCCGGAVKLLIETHVSHRQVLALFGAGHVAQALVPILAQLPLSVRWIDNRESLTPTEPLPANVDYLCDDEPVGEIPLLPAGSWVVIMTHDHQLDFELAEKALKHPDLPYVGMIGSQTKAKRFVHRLQSKGISDGQLSRFVTPIGLSDIPGKLPVEVAVSVSAQIIRRLHGVNATEAPLTADTTKEALHDTQ
ncbi:MAG: xanthine dehydrogenase accessory protein XdhC [Pseudomonadota bacterium]|nr:xanthine dehydrogenase accessory protein XdhC [Alteromonas sp.]MDY6927142.1 xanthine dehydrogenase accessory protein XdhC [Pseudomonadota bacterium]HCA75751.1 xanthine dehydrogenase accessory protein XdhC [Alteromonas sp.]HCB18416.1 xanthine dehydrogenase accessory protein XdhC [Alteromonas sp.]HCV18905.1 xanthine dehydrogenase accessory protein XdhC [Alteromonas sp.]